MKKKFLDFAINAIHSQNPTYDDIKLAELRYGLEAMYLTVTKLIVIFVVAAILGIFKEMVIMLLIYNILRTTGFGLHATKSWICLLSSTSVFIILPYVSTLFVIPISFKCVFAFLSAILVFLYAPADTKKRPLIHKKKRIIYKILTTLNCIIFNIISIFITNSTLSNLIIFGITAELIVILPISYRLFKFSYNNYKTHKPITG